MSDFSLTARCHPALEPILPKPRPAGEALPEWLRSMPSEVASETLGGEPVRTLKHCPPFLDALSLGILIPLACDLEVREGRIAWDWEPPAIPDQLLTRAPVGLHLAEQVAGSGFALTDAYIVKFTNFWTLEAPEGWSVLFTHPFGYPDLPFRTLSGAVECDRFGDGLVHFPALWTDPAFEGVLPAGTPVAQAIPVPRVAPALTVETMDDARQASLHETQEALQAARGVYRKGHRARTDRDRVRDGNGQ